MKNRKKALLIAFVLGDGYVHIDKRRSKNNASLVLRHSVKQKEYLEYKVDLLHSLVGGKVPSIITFKQLSGEYYGVRAEKAHKYFGILRRWMYPSKYSINILKHLTPEAIAIWYMDDGSCIVNNRYSDGTIRSVRTNIHTCCSLEEAQVISDYFSSTWNIEFKPFKEKGRYSIRCFHREGQKFHDLIRLYIIPSMRYKQRYYFPTSA